jgi:hypothetical protein
MLATVPLAFNFDLDTSAVLCHARYPKRDKEVLWAFGPAIGRLTFRFFWCRHKVLKSGPAQFNPIKREL